MYGKKILKQKSDQKRAIHILSRAGLLRLPQVYPLGLLQMHTYLYFQLPLKLSELI